MRTHEEYLTILDLWEKGYPKKAIARMTSIPRRTVIDCIQRFGTVSALDADATRIDESQLAYTLRREFCEENIYLYQAYAYLLGLYLGDGNISKVRNVYRLRVTLDARYPNIITRCSETIQILLPENQVGIVERFYQAHLSCVDVSCYYKHWTEVFPQHGEGMKHQREIKLEDWQQHIVEAYPLEVFRGLFHSDGSRFRNIVNGKDYPRYQFTNNSDEIRAIFCHLCDLLGVHWTVKRRTLYANRETDIFISKRPDVEYLDRVVGAKS